MPVRHQMRIPEGRGAGVHRRPIVAAHAGERALIDVAIGVREEFGRPAQLRFDQATALGESANGTRLNTRRR
jgi:hypothetical protein